ncbi:acyl carrier protein [bacterium 1XD21-13]|nr:acyl carrier protein [bacterium 1XD21-13]
MEKRVLEICEEICCQKISADEQLLEEGLLDSYRIMELVSELETEFKIVFMPKDLMELENFSSLKKIVKLIVEKIKGIK